jgi:hypothetical protein
MKSSVTNAKDYLASLPPERRVALEAVRRVILENLDAGYVECMQYGVVAYCVPHSGVGGWPHGHHTNPKLPLMALGFSSQKNDMVIYMLMLLHNKAERAWFDTAWKATGRKNHLEVTGMGCCLRFKKLEDLDLDVVAQAIRRSPVKKYLESHVQMLASRGLEVGLGLGDKIAKKTAKKPAKKAAKKIVKKTVKR